MPLINKSFTKALPWYESPEGWTPPVRPAEIEFLNRDEETKSLLLRSDQRTR